MAPSRARRLLPARFCDRLSSTLHRRLVSWFSLLGAAVPLFRPGSPMPGSAAPFSSGPGPDAASTHPRQRNKLRVSLSASLGEGVFAEVVTATAGGAVLTGWALYLNASPVLIGLLGALPFTSQFFQLPSAWLTSAFGYRKVALVAVGASRQLLWGLVALPFLPLGEGAKQTVLMTVAGLSALLGVVGNNAWVAWMGELVPIQLRGRYFGRRTALCTLGGTLAMLAAGVLLDVARLQGRADWALSGLAVVACVAGAVTTLLMRRQHQPTEEGGKGPFEFAAALRPFGDPSARKYLAFLIGWNLAIGVSSTFFAVHMLENLGMGFALMAAYNAAAAGLRIITAPLWGRAIDRFGPRTVLSACSYSLCIVPLIWLFPREGFLWPLAVEVLFSGSLWSGHALATFSLPLAMAPRKNRQFYLAAFATTGGIAFAIAATLGGLIVTTLPARFSLAGGSWNATHAVFLVSACGRIAAAFLTQRVVPAEARPVSELWAWMRLTVTQRVTGRSPGVPALAVVPERRAP